MKLYISATTNCPDLMLDFIEVRLKTGELVSLNWDESEFTRNDSELTAEYKGIFFDEEDAGGRLSELKDLQVEYIKLYSDSRNMKVDLSIHEMIFEDDEETLSIMDAYSIVGGEVDV